MALRLVENKGTRQITLEGLRNDFAKYERDMFRGKIPCPFTVRFLDTRYRSVRRNRRLTYEIAKKGKVIARGPVPLTPAGEPKIPLF